MIWMKAMTSDPGLAFLNWTVWDTAWFMVGWAAIDLFRQYRDRRRRS